MTGTDTFKGTSGKAINLTAFPIKQGPTSECVRLPAVVFLVLTAAIVTCAPVAAEVDPRVEASSEYAARLQKELGARLKAAMSDGGPLTAIEVCRVEAPRIADAISDDSRAAEVGRTALRVRNPANAPDAHAQSVLERFDAAIVGGEEPPLTDFTVFPDGAARYMRTIVTQPMCIACHGSSLAPEIQAAIAEHYPEDEATGFEPGELRGAFIVDWPPNPITE